MKQVVVVKRAFFFIFLLLLAQCGIKSNPLPPGSPAKIGRGSAQQPGLKRDFVFPSGEVLDTMEDDYDDGQKRKNR